jgi:hypothetical protein
MPLLVAKVTQLNDGDSDFYPLLEVCVCVCVCVCMCVFVCLFVSYQQVALSCVV